MPFIPHGEFLHMHVHFERELLSTNSIHKKILVEFKK